MIFKADLIPYLLVWCVVIFLVVQQSWKAAGAGLMLAYVFQMVMLYWVGAVMHVLPWSIMEGTAAGTTKGGLALNTDSLWALDGVYLGFQQSTYAIAAFALGSLLLGPVVLKVLQSRKSRQPAAPDLRLPRAYIIYGMCSYFLLAPTLGRVPGFNAIAAVGSQLVVVGCCLNCWRAWCAGGKKALVRAIGPTLLIPCVTVVVQGFLGFGVMAVAAIMVFCAQFFRPRWLLLVGFSISLYVGLSVYVTYMKNRNELRASVWGGDTLSERVDVFLEKAQTFELFDLWNQEHIVLVDNRLNQNGLVGAAVTYLENTDDYARGDTLREALIAMIPRLIWVDKPMEAGSGDLASRFTGIEFEKDTSVGVGPVMELYGNFGSTAVMLGFLFLGVMLKVIDVMAGRHLAMGNWRGFASWCLVGLSFVNVSGSFVEITMGAAASLALVAVVNRMLKIYTPGNPKASIEKPVQLAPI